MKFLDYFKNAITENAQQTYITTHYNMDQCGENLTTAEKFELVKKFEDLVSKIKTLEESRSWENMSAKQQLLEKHIIKNLKENPALMQMICLGKTTIKDNVHKGYMLFDIVEACSYNNVLMHMFTTNEAINAYDLDKNNLPMKALQCGRPFDTRRIMHLAFNSNPKAENPIVLDTTHTNAKKQNIGMFALERLATAIKNQHNNKSEFLADYLGVISDCLQNETLSTYQHPKTNYNLGMCLHDASADKRYIYLRDELLKLFDTALTRESAIKQENNNGENMYEMAAQGPFKYKYASLLATPMYRKLMTYRNEKAIEDYARSLEDE